LGNREIASSISMTRSDPSGLGCWVWFALSGRTRITTCIISAYHPSNSSLTHTNSIWAQHCSYLLSQDDPCEPRMAFLCDLGLAINLASGWRQHHPNGQHELQYLERRDLFLCYQPWPPRINSCCTPHPSPPNYFQVRQLGREITDR